MIQTKTAILYGDRSEFLGQIKIEVRFEGMAEEGNKYLVIDWDVTSGSTDAYKSKPYVYNNDKINQVDAYIEANYASELSGLSKQQKEWLKMVIALMLDTRTNLLDDGTTIYRLTADYWEFSPEYIEMFPFLATIQIPA